MKSKVFFTREITPEKVVELYRLLGKELPGKVAIKLHSGEVGNQNFLKPAFWKPIIDMVGGNVVECNTAYEGQRNTTAKHMSTLEAHGWKKYFRVDLMDAEGPDLELSIPEGKVIIASGPLTESHLAQSIAKLCGEEYLSFFDAAAPIVTFESLDQDKVFFAARYGRGEDDYINCPMDKEQYELFYNELVNAQSADLHEFEKQEFKVYEGCMPVEVMAKRGADTLRYGPLKPVGLTNPHTGRRPWAVVQLRAENREGTLYNLVGFQTNLKFPEQKRVFSLIPGLEHAEFVRYGVMHRNTFLNSPKLLTSAFCMKEHPDIYFAGQMTGVEGYVESAASGILAGKNMARAILGKEPMLLPADCMLGALSRYIADGSLHDFQPMGANMGILPPWPDRVKDKTLRYEKIAERGLSHLKEYLEALDQ